MDKLNMLLNKKCSIPVLREIIYFGWFAYVSDSVFAVRTPTDKPSDWQEIWQRIADFFTDFNPHNTVKVNLSVFDWVDTSEPKTCDECGWEWEVEREYDHYTRYDTCPVCDGFKREDPFDCVFVDIWGECINWRRLFDLVNVVGERDMFVKTNQYWTKLVYGECWDYQCVIKPANVDSTVSNIKILQAK